MKFDVFGETVESFEELLDVVINELTYDDTYIEEETGSLYGIDDIDDLHDFCCENVSDYDAFCEMLESEKEFDGLDIDLSDPYEEARRFYNSTRF